MAIMNGLEQVWKPLFSQGSGGYLQHHSQAMQDTQLKKITCSAFIVVQVPTVVVWAGPD